MKLANYFRISAPAAEKVPAAEVDGTYRRYRSRTFWGVTAAYSLYYVCRMVLSVVKQPLIDEGILTCMLSESFPTVSSPTTVTSAASWPRACSSPPS